MQFVSRKEWGARAPRSTSRISGVDGVAFHWGGPPVPKVHSNHSYCAAAVRNWQNFHMNSRGWADIAYSAVVCPHGYVYEARGVGRRTAANGTNFGNANYYAVCYLSGEGQPLTDAAKAGMMDARAWLMRNGAGASIRPHRFFKSTGCPGDGLVSWINAGCPTKAGAIKVGPTDPSPVLGKGDEGSKVEDVQRALVKDGFDLKVDGDFGPGTEAAVKGFQTKHGLLADGIVGPSTWAALRLVAHGKPVPAPTTPKPVTPPTTPTPKNSEKKMTGYLAYYPGTGVGLLLDPMLSFKTHVKTHSDFIALKMLGVPVVELSAAQIDNAEWTGKDAENPGYIEGIIAKMLADKEG